MKLILPALVNEKIMHWVNKSSFEVSGLGKVQVGPDGTCTVLDVMLLPQKNTTSHTDIEGGDVAKAMYTLRDTPGDLRFWWHSHVDMSVFWSGTDRETIKLCGQGGWCIATVFNKKSERRTAFYSIDGLTFPWGKSELFYDEIKTEVESQEPLLKTAWDDEYAKNVTNKVWGSQAGEKSASSGQTKSGTTSGSEGTTSIDVARLSKKERKRVKHLLKDRSEVTHAQVTETTPDEPLDVPDPDGDELPLFDEQDKMVMMASGLTEDDIESLNEVDYFTAYEMLDMVAMGWGPQEIIWAADYAETRDLDADEMMGMFTPQSRVGAEDGMGH